MIQQSHCWAYTLRKPDLKEMFITALFTIARTWKQHTCPSAEEWIKKKLYIYTMEYYSARKRNKIMPFAATWMELEIVTLNEVRKRKISRDIVYMWNLKELYR